MKHMSKNRCLTCALVLGSAWLVACEGDSRPFQESVEVEALGLRAIQITPPANAQDMIRINPGQTMQLGLSGNTDAESAVTLDASDRSWRSSDTSVLEVSENGLVTGVSTASTDATAVVSVSIGGISSNTLSIVVRDAALESIATIEGGDNLERCLPGEYFTVGNFNDGFVRTLFDVSYTLSEDSNATFVDTDPATAEINATTAGPILISAQVGDIMSDPRQLMVLDTLTELVITPEPAAVDEDETIDFTATGTYTTSGEGEGDLTAPGAPGATDPPSESAGTKSEIITANVNWEVTSGTANASVDNSGENKGRLLGLSQGTALLTASCGVDRQDTVSVVINDVAGSDSDELSFDVVGSRIVFVFGSDPLELRVSRGSDYDSDNELTVDDGVRFSVRAIDEGFVDNGSLANGVIRPLQQGRDIVVTADLIDDDDEIVASGSITIEIQ